MNKNDYYMELEDIVNQDCEKIMNEILELYYHKVEVNKSFWELVKERMNPKYFHLLEEYYFNIIRLIPKDLYICPNGRWALVTEEEYDDYLLEERYSFHISKEKLNEVIDHIIDDLLNSDDFFDTINKHLNSLGKCIIGLKEKKYIMTEIYYGLRKRGYTIVSINPLKIIAN